MSSTAFEQFNKTLRRSENLINSYEVLKADPNVDDSSISKDMIRGAVVISVAALDAYVTNVFSEKFLVYIRRYGVDNGLAKLLFEAGLDTKAALELINMERPYRRIRNYIDNYYSRSTTQRFNVIDELFKYYHIPNITYHAQNRTARVRLKRSVEKLVERRHEIAHNGDYNKHKRINDIDPIVIMRRIKDLELLVQNMDHIICNKIS